MLLGMGLKQVPVEYLVIAGGASGAGGGGYAGGGGGAGGVRLGTNHKIKGTITITVGGGGASTISNGNAGSDSVMADITSDGGGPGSLYSAAGASYDGGSGGGAGGGVGGYGGNPCGGVGGAGELGVTTRLWLLVITSCPLPTSTSAISSPSAPLTTIVGSWLRLLRSNFP